MILVYRRRRYVWTQAVRVPRHPRRTRERWEARGMYAMHGLMVLFGVGIAISGVR